MTAATNTAGSPRELEKTIFVGVFIDLDDKNGDGDGTNAVEDEDDGVDFDAKRSLTRALAASEKNIV